MSGKEKAEPNMVFDIVEGLSPVDPQALEPFRKAMDEAIPDIAREEDERRALAAESRRRQLKC